MKGKPFYFHALFLQLFKFVHRKCSCHLNFKSKISLTPNKVKISKSNRPNNGAVFDEIDRNFLPFQLFGLRTDNSDEMFELARGVVDVLDGGEEGYFVVVGGELEISHDDIFEGGRRVHADLAEAVVVVEVVVRVGFVSG